MLFCLYLGAGYIGMLYFKKYIELYTYNKHIFLYVYYTPMIDFTKKNQIAGILPKPPACLS